MRGRFVPLSEWQRCTLEQVKRIAAVLPKSSAAKCLVRAKRMKNPEFRRYKFDDVWTVEVIERKS